MSLPWLKGSDLKKFACWFGCRGNCPGCQMTLTWNLWRRFCHCGVPATGYRSMARDADVEFFCDDHFQDVPSEGDAAAPMSLEPIGRRRERMRTL
jgi:hypothetical protein